MKEQRPSRPRGRQPPTVWPRKGLLSAQANGRPTPEELQPDTDCQAAFALVWEQEPAPPPPPGNGDRALSTHGGRALPTFARSPGSHLSFRLLQADERGTSIRDSFELLQHPGCHPQGHAKRPLPTGVQEYRPRPVRPAEVCRIRSWSLREETFAAPPCFGLV